MNTQLQLPWVQPCEESYPVSTSTQRSAIQKIIQKFICWANESDRYANSLNSSIINKHSYAPKAISSNLLR